MDKLLIKCPNCGETLEFQSKAGDCCLLEYHINDVPPEIAIDLNGEAEFCKNCKEYVTLNVQTIVHIVPYIK